MTTRRDFLRRLALSAAGLYVADDVAELLEPRRKLWPGWGPAASPPDLLEPGTLILIHSNFVPAINTWLRASSPTSAMLRTARALPADGYVLAGSRLVFGTNVRYP